MFDISYPIIVSYQGQEFLQLPALIDLEFVLHCLDHPLQLNFLKICNLESRKTQNIHWLTEREIMTIQALVIYQATF